MSYQLGIDFGTTTIAAAVRRAGREHADVVPLGGGDAVSSALHLARDGGVTVGEGALRLAGIDPGRVVRGLAARVGDPTPIIVGRESWTAEELSARVVRWVADRVAERESGPAAGITLAHPAHWTPDTLQGLGAALDGQGVSVVFVAAFRAAAVAYAGLADGTPGDVPADVPAGVPADVIATYDLGGGRFDAAVLRRDTAGTGFALLGRPEGIDDVGGLVFDDLLWEHVRAALPDGIVLDGRTRRACLRAKETLSTKDEVVVRVRQGELRGDVRVDRASFEGLIAPHVDRTVAALRSAVASAELTPAELDAVVLVGGAARIPLVARTVSAELGRPVTLLTDPELVVARGAALIDPETAAPAAAVVEMTVPAVAVPAVAVPAMAEPEVIAPEIMAPEPVADAPAASVASLAQDPEPPTVTFALPTPVRAAPPAAGTPGVRVPAVLDGNARHRDRPRSLPRLLLGAGAVVVAAVVLVALFRTDGPLDPPLDPIGKDPAPRVTGAPLVPLPGPTEAVPVPVVDDIRAEDAAAEVRMTEPVRAGRSDNRSGPGRSPVERPVDTTPPTPSHVRTGGPRAAEAGGGTDAAPIGAAPRTPPTPAAPLARA